MRPQGLQGGVRIQPGIPGKDRVEQGVFMGIGSDGARGRQGFAIYLLA